MALVDAVEFYGRLVATGDMDRAYAVSALIHTGQFTERSAGDAIDNPQGYRERVERLVFSVDELLRVIDIGGKAEEFAMDMVRREGRRNAREMLRGLRRRK